MARRISACAALALLLAAACGTRVDVPAPDADTATTALPATRASVVHLPVTLELASIVRKVETLVPAGQSNEDEWHPLGRFPVVGTLYVKEMWERGPLELTLSGDRIEVATQVRYRARVAERACAPVVGCRWIPLAGCGHDGPMPTLRVGLVTTVQWRPDWSVVPHTRPRPVSAGVRCRLTEAKVDVTERVQEVVQKALNGVSPKVDDELREAVALRSRVEEVWGELQEPIRADSGVYLVLAPESVAVAAPTARGTRLATLVSVTLHPRVEIGDRPQVSPRPLPDFGRVAPGEGFRIALVAELPYETVNEALAKELVGKSFTVRDRTFSVRGARVYASSGRLAMAVRVGGDARGTIYLTGTPTYDTAAQVVSVPDLDFSVETKNVLGRAAEWLLYDRLIEQARAAARFPVGDRVAGLQRDVTTAMNRDLSRGVRLTGSVDALRPVGVVVTPRSLVAVVEGDGRAQIDVTVR